MPHIEYRGFDGKIWPSSTELTGLLPKEWLWSWYKFSVQKKGWQGWLDNKAKSEIGKKIGTAVHGHIEGWTNGSGPLDEVENSLAIAKSLYAATNPLVEKYVEIEPHLFSETLKIHGSADIIYKRHGFDGLRIGDYKTSYKKDPITHPVQLAVYALCWNETHEEQINDGDIFRVDKDSARLNVKVDEYTNLKQYYPVIKALRSIWEYLNAKE